MCEKENKVVRDIYINGEICDEMALEVIKQINEINREDMMIFEANRKLNKESQLPYEPINIIVNSCGGSVVEGCAIINTLEHCLAPIHTHAVGQVASMAIYIYCCGEVRTAGDLTSFGLHGIGGFCSGYAKEALNTLTYWKELANKLDNRLMEETKITQEDLDKCETCAVYYGYDEALEKGLITEDLYDDEILGKVIRELEKGSSRI